jgi:hypothetical protein
MSTRFLEKTHPSTRPGLSIPSIRTDTATDKEVLHPRPLGMESSSNESDTSLDDRKIILSRRLQILASSGDDTDDAYVKAGKGKEVSEIDDTGSEAPSEVSSNSSQKRKGSPKKGNRRQKSKARGATSPATPSIPGNRLYVGDIPLNRTEKDVVTFFSKIGGVKEVRMMKKNNGTFKVRLNLHTIPFSHHILKHQTCLLQSGMCLRDFLLYRGCHCSTCFRYHNFWWEIINRLHSARQP